jgi:hypothetical protein
MDKGTGSHVDEPMTSQQCDGSPHKLGRLLSFNCTGSDSKENDEPPAQLQSAAACLKEKSLGGFSFEAPYFSLGISDTSSQDTNIQSQEDLSKKLKASRPLIRVLVINDNHCGLTFFFEL